MASSLLWWCGPSLRRPLTLKLDTPFLCKKLLLGSPSFPHIPYRGIIIPASFSFLGNSCIDHSRGSPPRGKKSCPKSWACELITHWDKCLEVAEPRSGGLSLAGAQFLEHIWSVQRVGGVRGREGTAGNSVSLATHLLRSWASHVLAALTYRLVGGLSSSFHQLCDTAHPLLVASARLFIRSSAFLGDYIARTWWLKTSVVSCCKFLWLMGLKPALSHEWLLIRQSQPPTRSPPTRLPAG